MMYDVILINIYHEKLKPFMKKTQHTEKRK